MKRSALRAVLALGCLLGLACGDPSSGSAPSSGAPDATQRVPSATASASAKALPKSTEKPTKTFAKIRDNGAIGEPVVIAPLTERVLLESRIALSKLVPSDPLSLAVRTRPDQKLEYAHALYKLTLSFEQVVRGLTFDIKKPDGSTLTLAPGAASPPMAESKVMIASILARMELTAEGLSVSGGRRPWDKPAADLFSAPGSYTVDVRLRMKPGDKEVTLTSKPLTFEVVAAGGADKPIADLTAIAKSIVKDRAELAKSPELHSLVIDDVDGLRSFSFRVDSGGRRNDSYMLEVLLDPSGKEIVTDEFTHFTCIASGTVVETTRGPAPVESVGIGTELVSYDVEAGQFTESTVVAIDASHAERTLRFGALRVTASHPIYADGRWLLAGELSRESSLFRLDGSTSGALSPEVEGPSTVYDLSVTAPHTFFAGGLLVHNKVGHVPLGGQQPWGGWFYRRSATQ